MNNLSNQAWLKDKASQKIINTLTQNGKEARFIGGCVRDALCRRPVNDIDIATQEPPETVLCLLKEANIKTIPTGIEHGTITAVCDEKVFEITTLRRDVETDGRRAIVSFSEDWLEDAKRRDFTFNAMSVDGSGKLYDPFGGEEDLRAGRVRFVGNATERIKEDYLRLLRFFRFSALFSKGPVDAIALDACRTLAEGVMQLSGERISHEMLRLLEAPRPAKWISLMIKTGVMEHLIEKVQDPTVLEMLCAFEDKPDGLRRLAVLLPADLKQVEACGERFKLSNSQKERLKKARCQTEKLTPFSDGNSLRAFLYHYGAETALDHVFLYWAEKGFTGIGPKEQKLLDDIHIWQKDPISFPVQGRDLLEIGFKAGPELGKTLKQLESWWCDNGCYGDKESCLKQLSA